MRWQGTGARQTASADSQLPSLGGSVPEGALKWRVNVQPQGLTATAACAAAGGYARQREVTNGSGRWRTAVASSPVVVMHLVLHQHATGLKQLLQAAAGRHGRRQGGKSGWQGKQWPRRRARSGTRPGLAWSAGSTAFCPACARRAPSPHNAHLDVSITDIVVQVGDVTAGRDGPGPRPGAAAGRAGGAGRLAGEGCCGSDVGGARRRADAMSGSRRARVVLACARSRARCASGQAAQPGEELNAGCARCICTGQPAGTWPRFYGCRSCELAPPCSPRSFIARTAAANAGPNVGARRTRCLAACVGAALPGRP